MPDRYKEPKTNIPEKLFIGLITIIMVFLALIIVYRVYELIKLIGG